MLPCPMSFDAWRRCYRVARAATLIIDASLTALDAYEEHSHSLSAEYPRHLGVIAKADGTTRSAQWDRIREKSR